MRIFLGNAPWRKKGRIGVRAGSRWPFTLKVNYGTEVSHYVTFPFFLAYSTSVLREAGHEAMLVDAIAEGNDIDLFLKRAENFGPRIMALETSTPTINVDLEIARKAKRLLGKDTLIALVGPHVSVMKGRLLNEAPFVDFILIGEYEMTLRELADTLEKGGKPDKILGIVYRDETGAVRENPRRPVIMDLDSLPRPAYDQLPMYNYNDNFSVIEFPNVQIWTSRGCPYNCIFCMWPAVMYGNHRYRTRDPVKVADEIEWLINNYGFKAIYIDDDTFNLGKKRLLKFCDEMINRELNVQWAAMARADTMDEEVIEAMAKAGLVGIKYGVESASQEIIDRSGKRLNLDKVEKTIEATKRLGIKVHLTFTFGLPGETKETIKKTIEYSMDKQVHSVQFSIATPFPGTEFFKYAKENGYLLSENWDDFDGFRNAVVRTKELTPEDLQEALETAVSTWWSKRELWV